MNRFLALLFIILAVPVEGQEKPVEGSLPLLKLETAITAAVLENHDVRIAEKEAEKAENRTFIGNVGLLPFLSASGGYNWDLKNTNIEFAVPEQNPINRKNARSTALNGALMLNYTIFDGLSRFYRLNSLQELARLSEEEIRMAVENTVFGVLQRYFDIARLSRQLRISLEAIEITKERLKRAQSKYDLGAMDRLQVLNAQVDLNSDSLNYAQALQQLGSAKYRLKVLMGQLPDDNFSVEDEFAIDPALQLEIIMDKALNNNTNLIMAEISAKNAEIQQKVAKAGLYPELRGNFGYEYAEQSTEAGFITSQENYGWTGGIQISIPIFKGKQQRIQVQNAQLDLEINKERLSRAKLQVRRNVLIAFREYESVLFQLRLSEDDLEQAELSLERSEEFWQLGQISDTDLRASQINFIQTANRINNLIIQAKLSEIRLLKLAGTLEQEFR